MKKDEIFQLKQEAAVLAVEYANHLDLGAKLPKPTDEYLSCGKVLAERIRSVGERLRKAGWKPPCIRCGNEKEKDKFLVCQKCEDAIAKEVEGEEEG